VRSIERNCVAPFRLCGSPVRSAGKRRIKVACPGERGGVSRVLQFVLDDEPAPDVDREGAYAEHREQEDCGDDRNRASLLPKRLRTMRRLGDRRDGRRAETMLMMYRSCHSYFMTAVEVMVPSSREPPMRPISVTIGPSYL